MIVAARAAYRQAHERGTNGARHLDQHLLPVRLLILIAAYDVDGPHTMEAGGDQSFLIGRPQFIAGNLLFDEPVVRLLTIERVCDVIAIAPGLYALAIGFVAVRVGIAHHIQPFERPSLAVVRRSKQAVH